MFSTSVFLKFRGCVNKVYRAFTDDFMCNLHQKYGSLHRCKPNL